MTPWVTQLLPKEDIDLFKKIKRTIDLLPDIDLGKDDSGKEILLSCHILARAISKVFGLKCVDGSYQFFYPSSDFSAESFEKDPRKNALFTSCSHSWVLTPNRNIIDVYPIGVIGGPILVSCHPLSPISKLYFTLSTRSVSNGLFSTLFFKRSVRKMTQEVEKVKNSF